MLCYRQSAALVVQKKFKELCWEADSSIRMVIVGCKGWVWLVQGTSTVQSGSLCRFSILPSPFYTRLDKYGMIVYYTELSSPLCHYTSSKEGTISQWGLQKIKRLRRGPLGPHFHDISILKVVANTITKANYIVLFPLDFKYGVITPGTLTL